MCPLADPADSVVLVLPAWETGRLEPPFTKRGQGKGMRRSPPTRRCRGQRGGGLAIYTAV